VIRACSLEGAVKTIGDIWQRNNFCGRGGRLRDNRKGVRKIRMRLKGGESSSREKRGCGKNVVQAQHVAGYKEKN